MGLGKLGTAMVVRAEPAGGDKSHPWGSDLSKPELCELQSKVCGLWLWLGWPVGEGITKTGKPVDPGLDGKQG